MCKFLHFINYSDLFRGLISLLGIIIGAIVVYCLGLKAYKKQKNYEEIRDFYLKGGLEYLHQEISFYFAAFQNNYEILMTLLKNIRDYIPNTPICFDEIKISLVDYYPKGFAFRSIHNVEYLVGDDILTTKTYNLFSHLSAARICFNEIYITIRKLMDNAQSMLPDEESMKSHYSDLVKDVEGKREIIYENLYILDIIAGIINRIRDKFYFYATVNELKEKIKKDSEIQRLLQLAIWKNVLKEMEKGGIPLTAFLGPFSDDESYQESRIQKWEKFRILIEKKYVMPCTYKESNSPPEIQEQAEKWKMFLSQKYKIKYSGSYKLSGPSIDFIRNIKNILLTSYTKNN